MADQAKRKEAASQSAHSRPTPDSFPSSASSSGGSSNDQDSDARLAAIKEEDAKKGPIQKLIYGTAEGREMEKEIEHSFSQILARGKYMHSIVFHEVKPDKVDEYVELVGSWYPRMAGMPENKVHLVGSWRTEVGDCDTFGMFSVFYIRICANNLSPYLGISALPRIP